MEIPLFEELVQLLLNLGHPETPVWLITLTGYLLLLRYCHCHRLWSWVVQLLQGLPQLKEEGVAVGALVHLGVPDVVFQHQSLYSIDVISANI